MTSTLHFLDTLQLGANTPITQIDPQLVGVFDKDTLSVPFRLQLDAYKNKVDVNFEYEPNQDYIVKMLPGAIKDFFEDTNDTISLNLKTGSFADYANMSVALENVTKDDGPFIVELMKEKSNEVVRTAYINDPTETLDFKLR